MRSAGISSGFHAQIYLRLLYTVDHFNSSQAFIKDSRNRGVTLISVSQSAMKWNT